MLIIFVPVVDNEGAALLVEVYPKILLSVITEIFDRYLNIPIKSTLQKMNFIRHAAFICTSEGAPFLVELYPKILLLFLKYLTDTKSEPQHSS